MTHTEFNALLTERWQRITQTMSNKSIEYSTSVDKLHNFKAAAAILRCTPAEACLGFLTKHLVSIVDMVKAHGTNEAMINEKIGDAINYLILLEAILKERL